MSDRRAQARARRAAPIVCRAPLPERSAEASARAGVTRGQALIAGATALLLLIGSIAYPLKVANAISFFFCACALAIALFRVAAMTTPRRPTGVTAKGSTDLKTWPRYTVIAPVYREAAVMGDLVAALERLDYPRDRLEILITVEADDAETRHAAETLATPDTMRVVVAPPGTPRTKPRALNIALAQARGDVVTVFDAEDRPHPQQLQAAAAAFAAAGPDLACVQAPLGWYNSDENWLTRQFALEYAAQFHVIMPALARWGWPLPLGGTSNHFRRAALHAVGGWDAHNVTEDADMGFRLAAFGYRADVIAPGTLEEATTTRAAWTRQRSRWIKGFMQTWAVHMRDPLGLARRGGWRSLICLQLTIGFSVVASLAHAPLLLAFIGHGLWAVAAPDTANLGAGPLLVMTTAFAASVATAALGAARAGLGSLAWSAVSSPAYWLLHTPAAVRAALCMIRHPFHWEKTTHGVSQAPRRPPARRARVMESTPP